MTESLPSTVRPQPLENLWLKNGTANTLATSVPLLPRSKSNLLVRLYTKLLCALMFLWYCACKSYTIVRAQLGWSSVSIASLSLKQQVLLQRWTRPLPQHRTVECAAGSNNLGLAYFWLLLFQLWSYLSGVKNAADWGKEIQVITCPPCPHAILVKSSQDLSNIGADGEVKRCIKRGTIPNNVETHLSDYSTTKVLNSSVEHVSQVKS